MTGSAELEPLLAPLSAESPCGPSLRYDNDFDRLRELRREDDTSLPTGVWKSEIKRGDWAAQEKLASELLSSRSKDLMVAAWLGEAWLHRRGIEGFAQALALVVGLCERYPDALHPQAEDNDQSWRVTPLDWLARQYAEILHTRTALFAEHSGDFASFTLYQWQQLQQQQVQGGDNKNAKAAAEQARLQQQKLNEQIRETPLAFWLQRQRSLEASFNDLQRLDFWSDVQLQDLAPSYHALREVMAALAVLIQEFITMHPQQPVQLQPLPLEPAQADLAPTAAAEPAASNSANASNPATGFGSREEAYRQLLVIADYLARTEPHSPVPYLIKRAVEWGNKPLNELLSELISADSEARRVWSLLGVLK
ncbi:type VI secretion system protein ImpA [Pseudomonas sp. TE3786]